MIAIDSQEERVSCLKSMSVKLRLSSPNPEHLKPSYQRRKPLLPKYLEVGLSQFERSYADQSAD